MIDNEELEENLDLTKHVLDSLGMISYEHFVIFKENATLGLMRSHNDFLYHLGNAMYHASEKDAVKIIRVWANECTQHEMIYRIMKAKDEAECGKT